MQNTPRNYLIEPNDKNHSRTARAVASLQRHLASRDMDGGRASRQGAAPPDQNPDYDSIRWSTNRPNGACGRTKHQPDDAFRRRPRHRHLDLTRALAQPAQSIASI